MRDVAGRRSAAALPPGRGCPLQVLGRQGKGLALTYRPTGLYGPEGILPARRMLRPQGKGRWQQLWETPTLLWEAPRLGLDTAQGLELLSLLGTVLALGPLLLRRLRHPLVYLLLWAAYLSACQASGTLVIPPHPASLPLLHCTAEVPCSLTALLPAGGPGVPLLPVVSDSGPIEGLPFLGSPLRGSGGVFGTISCPHRDSLLLETGFLAVLVAPLRQFSSPKQTPQGPLVGASACKHLTFWLVRWLLFRLMFASGVVKLTSRCPAWWGLTGECPGLDLGSPGEPSKALTTHLCPQPSLTTMRHSVCPHPLPGLHTTCPSGCTSSAWWLLSSSRSQCPSCSLPLFAACVWPPFILR